MCLILKVGNPGKTKRMQFSFPLNSLKAATSEWAHSATGTETVSAKCWPDKNAANEVSRNCILCYGTGTIPLGVVAKKFYQ